jgi:signal transduction histidine kinase
LPPALFHTSNERRPAASALALQVALVAAVYYVAGKLGLSLAFGNTSASPVWPATGIALAALLVQGNRLWPAVFLGAFLVNVTTAGTVLTSLGIAAGNTLEAVLGAWAIRRFANGVHTFDRASDTLRFVPLALAAPLAAASVGLATLSLGGLAPPQDRALVWLTWWLGDSCGALILAPALILWSRGRRLRWTRDQVLEGSALALALAIITQAVFGWAMPIGAVWISLKFLCIPFLVWAALRFDPAIAASGVVLVSTLAVIGFLRTGSSSGGWSRNTDLVLLQVFMAITAMTTLALAAVVAERKRAMESARETLGQLRETLSELETFSHSLTHDLRNYIGGIQNFTGLLEEDFRHTLGPQGKHYLERMRAAVQGMTTLLDQLSQLSRVDRHSGEPSTVDMTSVARTALAEVRTGMLLKPGLEFQLQDLPPGWGNTDLLVRVYRNLLSNAVKFTRPREAARVEMGGSPGQEENVYFVKDNGIGFAPEFREKVFQPFQRVGNVRELEGSGLGLAIVAKIVRSHGGRVWAESDGVTGAGFFFTLPNAERVR